MEYEYDNIISLAKKSNYKKIMIMRNSWGKENWCIVNKIVIKPDKKIWLRLWTYTICRWKY